jgi:hypothetical protein
VREMSETDLDGGRTTDIKICEDESQDESEEVASALVASASLGSRWRQQSIRTECAFCGCGHLSEECQVHSDCDARVDQLRRTQRCFRCLVRGHIASNCRRSQSPCPHCGKSSHHPSVCYRKFKQPSDKQGQGFPLNVAAAVFRPLSANLEGGSEAAVHETKLPR